MDYHIRDGINGIRFELRNASVEIHKNENRGLRISVPKGSENSIRAIPHNSTLYIKFISDEATDIKISLPDSIREMSVVTENGSVKVERIQLDSISIDSRGNTELIDVTARKRCSICTDNSVLKLTSCDISSMNLQMCNGEFLTDNSILHGNSMAYVTNSTISGTFRGVLPDYVINAGSGISTDDIIVNDHRLTEFPDRKNVQNCAWLLIAGSLKETAKLRISKPRYINGY